MMEYSDDESEFEGFTMDDVTSGGTEGFSEDARACSVVVKKTRWKHRNPQNWKKNVAKTLRSQGQPYCTKGKQREAKAPKPINCEKCRFKCNENFSDEYRNKMCLEFWGMEYRRQKDFILSKVMSTTPKCHVSEIRKRTSANKYHFYKNGNLITVCQLFFVRTLCIDKEVVMNAFVGISETGCYIGQDNRGRRSPVNKTPPEVTAMVKSHIESFPIMESHFCRKSTERLYLDAKLSITKMYNLYQEECVKENRAFASFITYKRYFGNNYNLSFFKPKKDQCQICDTYNKAKGDAKKLLQKSYDAHQQRKHECNSAKKLDKERSVRDPTFVSATLDLESVLQCPSSDTSPMYYARKLCVYNLAIYEAAPPNEAYCYCWNEINGKRGSCEIGTCLYEFLSNLPTTVSEVSLFSDTCGGQNRNRHIAALLLFIVRMIPNIRVIEHKYLESGHSFMEADSMHSAIESAKKNVPVYDMNGWIDVFKAARSNRLRNKVSDQYHVKELKFGDFLNLKELSKATIKNRIWDTNKTKVNWMLIKSFRYSKEEPDIIQYKYSHVDAYKSIEISGRNKFYEAPTTLPMLYDSQLSISCAKKKDLLKLCRQKAIPEEYHWWYQSLPTSSKVKDYTVELAVGEESSCETSDSEVSSCETSDSDVSSCETSDSEVSDIE